MYKPYDKLLDNITYICCLIGVVGSLFVILFSFIFKTGIHLEKFVAPCMLNSLTGYYCPGCGGTRAVSRLLSGDILMSLYYHPIVLYTIIPGIWFMISQTIYRIHKSLHGDMPYKILTGKYSDNSFVRFITRPASVRMWYIYSWIAIVLIQCIIKNVLHAATPYVL